MSITLLIAVSACGSLPAPTPIPATPILRASLPDELAGELGADAETAARALIVAEREAAISGDLQTLAALWAPDARIVDGRGTGDASDDYVWQGRPAVMDRYSLAVLPAPPPPFEAGQLDALTVAADAGDENTAYAELGVDRWTLTRQEDRWQLLELAYN